MKTVNKTKSELIEELEKLKRRNARLEKAALRHMQATTHKEAQKALQASQKLLETIIEATPT